MICCLQSTARPHPRPHHYHYRQQTERDQPQRDRETGLQVHALFKEDHLVCGSSHDRLEPFALRRAEEKVTLTRDCNAPSNELSPSDDDSLQTMEPLGHRKMWILPEIILRSYTQLIEARAKVAIWCQEF